MIRVMRNNQKTRSGCPVISDAHIAAYLSDGELQADTEYLEIPPGKIVRQHGFWLRPQHRMHHTAVLFLISTDVYAMNVDEHAEQRDQIYCYRSPQAKTAYLGRVEHVSNEHRIFTPLIEGLHDPLDIDEAGLLYVGRVIAAL